MSSHRASAGKSASPGSFHTLRPHTRMHPTATTLIMKAQTSNLTFATHTVPSLCAQIHTQIHVYKCTLLPHTCIQVVIIMQVCRMVTVSQARRYGFSLFITQQPHGPHFKGKKQTQRDEVTYPRSHSSKVRN